MIKKILFIMLIIFMVNVTIVTATQDENTYYKTHDGRWISEPELEKGTSNYPYLVQDTGAQWGYTSDGKTVYIPKTFDIIEYPTKISPCLTYSKTALSSNMINHNVTVAYLVFPYSLSSVKTWSDENNIKFGSWLFRAGTEHISIYDESGNYLSPEYYEFRIINDEIRLYFVKSEANLLYGNITFEMHSWILDGHTSFENSGDYYIDTNNFWITDSINAGGENIYIANKTIGYTPNGSAVFEKYHGYASANYLDTVDIDSTEFIYESSVKLASSADDVFFGTSVNDAWNSEYAFIRWNDGASDLMVYSKESADPTNMGFTYAEFTPEFNEFHNYKLVKTSSDLKMYYDDSLKVTRTTYLPDSDLGIGLFILSGTPEQDYSFVRKYAENEPTVNVTDKGTYYEIYVNSVDELIDYQIKIPRSELDIISDDESWNIYQSVIHPVENLTATPYIESALIEWDNISAADYYNIYRIEPSILFTNETLILDGVLDNAYSDIGQRGLLHTPNPEYVNQFDTIYALINETYIFMYANAHDDDTSSVDDSIEIYFDFTQNGLTTDDKGYIIKENEQIIEQEWSGSQWISGGGTDAEGVVLGAGTNNTDYELFIPLSELPELTYGTEIDLVVMHENTAVATTQSYFPLTAFSIENVTGWQNMFIENSSMAADLFLFNTTENMFNLTGLDSISWYRIGVSAVFNVTETNITYVEFITQHYPEYYIDGYVYDVNTSLGIQNSVVTITDTFTSGFQVTDARGYYRFNGLRNDFYTIEASAVGYSTESVSLTINDTDVTADNIYLEYLSYTLEEIYNKIVETNDNLESKILNLETTINHLKIFILMSAMIVIGALYENKRRK